MVLDPLIYANVLKLSHCTNNCWDFLFNLYKTLFRDAATVRRMVHSLVKAKISRTLTFQDACPANDRIGRKFFLACLHITDLAQYFLAGSPLSTEDHFESTVKLLQIGSQHPHRYISDYCAKLTDDYLEDSSQLPPLSEIVATIARKTDTLTNFSAGLSTSDKEVADESLTVAMVATTVSTPFSGQPQSSSSVVSSVSDKSTAVAQGLSSLTSIVVQLSDKVAELNAEVKAVKNQHNQLKNKVSSEFTHSGSRRGGRRDAMNDRNLDQRKEVYMPMYNLIASNDRDGWDKYYANLDDGLLVGAKPMWFHKNRGQKGAWLAYRPSPNDDKPNSDDRKRNGNIHSSLGSGSEKGDHRNESRSKRTRFNFNSEFTKVHAQIAKVLPSSDSGEQE